MGELGPARPIDELIATYRKAQEVVDNREQVQALAEKLGDAILGPIAKVAGSFTEWWVASDGELRQLLLVAPSEGAIVAAPEGTTPLVDGSQGAHWDDTPLDGSCGPTARARREKDRSTGRRQVALR